MICTVRAKTCSIHVKAHFELICTCVVFNKISIVYLKTASLFNEHTVYTWLSTTAGSISGIPIMRFYPAPPVIQFGSQPFSCLGLVRRCMGLHCERKMWTTSHAVFV
jgi:hypothetical protein